MKKILNSKIHMKIFTLIFCMVWVCTNDIFAQTDTPPPPRLKEAQGVEPLKEVDISDQPFTYVEKMPQFPGGSEMMYKFIGENLRTPDSCRVRNISGTVITQFVVDTAGYIVKPRVVRSPQPECGYSEEALRVLLLMNKLNPRWSPGMHNGRKIPVTFTLPFKFVINGE